MGKNKATDIAVQTLMMANPIIDPLANAIEDEHLELHYDFLYEQGVDESILEVIDDPVYDSFWADLKENFDKYFQDNGLAVMTYENDDYQLLSPEQKKEASERFADAMLAEAKKEIQQRIDMAILDRQSS